MIYYSCFSLSYFPKTLVHIDIHILRSMCNLKFLCSTVSVTRPPDYTQAQHRNRYSSQYALKNRATKHIFDDESSKTHKQQRVRSAQTRQPSNKDKKGKRRVQSASLSRTREFIAQQAQLIDSQKQVVLFKPTNTATPSASHDDSSYVHTSKVVDKTNSFTETRDEGHLRYVPLSVIAQLCNLNSICIYSLHCTNERSVESYCNNLTLTDCQSRIVTIAFFLNTPHLTVCFLYTPGFPRL